MKTLFLICLTITLAFSCKKEPCFECKTYTYSKPYEILVDVQTDIVCDKDEIEILDYQIDRYKFTDSYYTTCECKKR